MAIQGLPQTTHGGVNIEAWTEEAIHALSTINILAATAPSGTRGMSVTLDIPLDDEHGSTSQRRDEKTSSADAANNAALRAAYAKRREPQRRDSMKRREALLKGKEGSRRRQRWENGMSIAH